MITNNSDIRYSFPADLAANPAINPSVKLVYAYLYFASQQGKKEAYPKQSTIALKVGLSRMQVSRCCSKLEELGLIESIQRGKKQSNLYKVKCENVTTLLQKVMCENVTSIGSAKMLLPYEKKTRKENSKLKERERKTHTSEKTTSDLIVSEANNVLVSERSERVSDVGCCVSAAVGRESEANTVSSSTEETPKLDEANNAHEIEKKELVMVTYQNVFGKHAAGAVLCDKAYLIGKYKRLDLFRHCQMLAGFTDSGLASYRAYIIYAIEYKRLNGSYPVRPAIQQITQHDLAGTPPETVARIAVEFANTPGKRWDYFGDFVRSSIGDGYGEGPGEGLYDETDDFVKRAIKADQERTRAAMAAAGM